MPVRPFDGNAKHHIWIAKALSNPEHPGYVLIQYFRSMLHNKNVQKFYICWDFGNGLRWKVDSTNAKV